MGRPRGLTTVFAILAAMLAPFSGPAQTPPVQDNAPPPSASSTVIRTSVRRVLLDVVVTDNQGNTVTGLQPSDFTVTEDNSPQHVLSFDIHGFDAAMDYTPPRLPSEPPNTFINLPSTPEKGPLYVLLYDLVNMDNEDQMALSANEHPDQMRGRQELIKFINNAPEGARIAIFVRSDGLHLIQGFTSDKALLLAAIDPHHPGPHIPQIYLMGQNMGRGDTHSGMGILGQLASYLDGLPGRKNLVWFSGSFPLVFFATPSIDDSPDYVDRLKRLIDLLARNQIAIYPVDVRGVVVPNWHGMNGVTQDGAIVSSSGGASSNGVTTSDSPGGGAGGTGAGVSLLQSSYFAEDEIAKETGGHAFYSNNDVAGLLQQAVKAGTSYYTLTYNPSNRDYDGKVRNIKVTLDRKGCTLSYRRFYYGDSEPSTAPSRKPAFVTTSLEDSDTPAVRPPGDSLSANMQHGAPIAHQLLFGTTVRADGPAVMATAQQMAELVTNADRFRPSHRGKPADPVPLQRYTLKYGISATQFRALDNSLELEIAVAAFDADGQMLNATVSLGSRTPAAGGASSTYFRVEQALEVPTSAAFLRFAVRDPKTDRIGATEIKLPLAPVASASAPKP